MAQREVVAFNQSTQTFEAPNIGDEYVMPRKVNAPQGAAVTGLFTVNGNIVGALDSGVASSVAPLAINDTSKLWAVNSLQAGVSVSYTSGGAAAVANIASNTGTQIVLQAGSPAPSASTAYRLYGTGGGGGMATGVYDPAGKVKQVATTDINNEIIEQPSGAAAEVAAARTAGYKRANGTWNRVATLLGTDFPLQTWTDTLVTGVVYSVRLLVAQNGLPAGWWHLEVLRHAGDTVSTEWRNLRATGFAGTNDGVVFTSYDRAGTWSSFTRLGTTGWLPVTLLNGNTKFAADHFGIRKTPDGTVTAAGIIRTPVTGTLFAIPAGYIPNTMTPGATTLLAPAQDSAGGASYTYVQPNSNVFTMMVPGVQQWVVINHSWQVI